MTIRELEHQLLTLPPEQKAQMLHILIADLTKSWSGIEKTPEVVGGDACIVRTRIPVWGLEGYRRAGWSDEQILENFPTLRADDLAHAWAYVAANRGEIERALQENQEA